METVIIDYGMGNLLSVQRAFEKCGSDAVIIDNPLDLREAEHIVLPGVGAFPDAMNNLRDGGWIEELNRAVLEKETPILGICLGMQLLAERGYEVCECGGLGYIPGEIVRFEQTQAKERIPHVGWNDIEKRVETPLFDGIEDGTNYYFVHSYHFKVRMRRILPRLLRTAVSLSRQWQKIILSARSFIRRRARKPVSA